MFKKISAALSILTSNKNTCNCNCRGHWSCEACSHNGCAASGHNLVVDMAPFRNL